MAEVEESTPKLKEDEKFVKNTTSVCPECYQVLPATIFERDDKIWIRKVCPEHGEVEALYWGDSDMYHRAMQFTAPERNITGLNIEEMVAPCPLNCGYCPEHKNQTALANIVATNRCDLSCWYCFFYAKKAGYVYEPSIPQIRQMVRSLQKQGPFPPNAIQITGGEPLIREDLLEMINAIKEEGITHIQLNTNGIRFAKLLIKEGKEEAVELGRRLRDAGVNTLYLSFDGVTPQTNPKNHYEIPYIFNILRLSELKSITLVPTIIKNQNAHEVGDMVKFASQNQDIVRAINFQPVSLTGSMPREKRKEHRITIPGVIKKIEEQTEGEISQESWFPVSWPYRFSEFIELLTEEPTIMFLNHPVCGMGTYVFPEVRMDDGRRVIDGYTTIAEFLDVKGFWDYLKKKNDALRRGRNKWIIASELVANLISRFIDSSKAPEGVNMKYLIANILWRRDYKALGELHYKSVFLGMMHFQDLYNYDIQRVKRCDISYLSPDGRVIPFCAFNVLPDIYRDKIQKEYGVPINEWEAKHPGKAGANIKYDRDVDLLKSTQLYKRTYEGFL